MFCPKCGTKNEDTARFCMKCGAQLVSIEQPRQAPPAPTAKPKRRPRSGLRAVAAVVVLLVLVVVCGAVGLVAYQRFGPGKTMLTADDIIVRAGEKMESLDSVHFALQVTGEPVFIDTLYTLALEEAEGDLVCPDRIKAVVKASEADSTIEGNCIRIRRDQYMIDPLTQRWTTAPQRDYWIVDPTLLCAPDGGANAFLGPLTDLQQLDDEVIGGQPHYHLSGTITGELIAFWTEGKIVPRGAIEVDVWIGQDDFYVRRVRLEYATSDSEQPTTWLLELSDFNEPVTIEPPF